MRSIREKSEMILAMSIFGSVGVVVKYISMPTEVVALCRGLIGFIFLFFVLKVKKEKMKVVCTSKEKALLIISGFVIGINWFLFFESMNYTTVATATVFYYLAPVFVTIASPFIFHNRIKKIQVIEIAMALIGSYFIAGGISKEAITSEYKGIILATLAALLYGTVIILNKYIKDMNPVFQTDVQLLTASMIMIPYIIWKGTSFDFHWSMTGLVLILVVGILHTGIAYLMYFSGMQKISSYEVAVFSYIDPLVAIILSVFLLNENMSIEQMLGSFFILGATFMEIVFNKKQVMN